MGGEGRGKGVEEQTVLFPGQASWKRLVAGEEGEPAKAECLVVIFFPRLTRCRRRHAPGGCETGTHGRT